MADINARLPVRYWLELHGDGKVYQHSVKKGRYREYGNTGPGRASVCLGDIEEIEKKRPELIPKIKNYNLPENRGVVPIADRVQVKDLPKRLGLIKDPEIVKAMMATDKRPGALGHYVKRLERLEEGAAEEMAAAEA